MLLSSLFLSLLAGCHDAEAPVPAEPTVVSAPAAVPRAILLARHPELQVDGQAVTRTEALAGVRRTGLSIAAGGSVAFRIQVTEGAHLGFEAGGIGGDGALEIAVGSGATADVVERAVLPAGIDALPKDVALPGAGEVRLELRNTGTSEVFLFEPTVYVPRNDRQVVLVVVADTLRRDHLGLYGGTPTTSIDALALHGTVFDQAYTIAPWTLPATRALLSGRWPESWDPTEHLGATMAAAGFYTAFFTGSPYLGPSFGMAEGWSWHATTDGSAEIQVQALLNLVTVVPDRDLFVVLHTMDTHLPYGPAVKSDPPPPGIEEPLVRARVLTALGAMRAADRDEALAWLARRYQAQVTRLDTALAPVLGALSEKDIAVVVSDHGEELGDHGGYEHGHSVHQELVHVPLIIQASALPPGRRPDPVSLLDLAPTLHALVGVGPSDNAFAEPRGDRAPAFGYRMYGDASWGLVWASEKWITGEGREVSYDLATDPREAVAIPTPADAITTWQERLAEALDRPVVWTWRLEAPVPMSMRTSISIERARPFEQVWSGPGPAIAPPTEHVLAGNRFRTRWGAKTTWPGEVFLAPGGAEPSITVQVEGTLPVTLEVAGPPGVIGGVGGFRLHHALAPEPLPVAHPDETPADAIPQLRTLGYVE